MEFNAKSLNEKVYTSSTTPWYNAGLSESEVTVTIGDNVTQIPAYCFAYFTSLKHASIGALVESIGNQAFAQTSLADISMPKTVQFTASSFPASAEVTYLDTFNIKFNSNGGTAIESYKTLENRLIQQPTDPTKDGFTFAGWFADSELNTEYDFNSPVTQDTTLYASWTENNVDNPAHEKSRTDNIPTWGLFIIILLVILIIICIIKVIA